MTGDDKKVVRLAHDAPPSQMTAMACRCWDEYCRLRDRAQQSQDIEDGIAAGKAWGRFIRNFEKDT